MGRPPIAVHVLTGFFGSGKTTLLNKLLRDPALADTAVIVNEFGEVPLDHILLRPVAGETLVLANGCVCCTVRSDLAGALVELLESTDCGKVPDFSRVIVETTGLADPVPVLGTLENHPVVRHHFRRGRVMTTVDAMNAFTEAAWSTGALHQISAADWIILTKTDLAPRERREIAMEKIRALNPLAEIAIGTDQAGYRLLPCMDSDPAELPCELMNADGRDTMHGASHAHPLDHGSSPVKSVSIILERPIDWPAFGAWVSLLLHAHGEQVLRLKGILNVSGSSRPIFVNGVRRALHRPIHLDGWTDRDRRSRLVLIVAGLEPAVIRRSLDLWLARAART